MRCLIKQHEKMNHSVSNMKLTISNCKTSHSVLLLCILTLACGVGECVGHGRAVSSALYPPRMCKIISRHILSAQATSYLTQGDIHTNTPAVETNENEKVEGLQEAGEEPRNETISMEELKGIKAAITKLHVRSGHPTNTALANCLRARGVPKHVVQPALEHKCDSCQEVRLVSVLRRISNPNNEPNVDRLT